MNAPNDTFRAGLAKQLSEAFPAPAAVPEEFRINPSAYERLYLLDGQLQDGL